jgi:hypothetical protein
MEIAEEREKEGEGEMGWESREWAVGKDMWTRIGQVISLARWESSDASDVRLLALVYRKTVM